MTRLFEKAAELDPEEQDEFARLMLAELKSEERWASGPEWKLFVLEEQDPRIRVFEITYSGPGLFSGCQLLERQVETLSVVGIA